MAEGSAGSPWWWLEVVGGVVRRVGYVAVRQTGDRAEVAVVGHGATKGKRKHSAKVCAPQPSRERAVRKAASLAAPLPRAPTGPERRNMVDLSGPINMDIFMHCMTNIRLGKDEYKELTQKEGRSRTEKEGEKMPTQTVPEMQTELKELLEKLSSAADEREAPPRDSTIVTYPPGSPREGGISDPRLLQPATDTEIKKEFQKRAAAQLRTGWWRRRKA